MTTVVRSAGVSVTAREGVSGETEKVLDRLVTDGIPASLEAKSPRLWGSAAAAEAGRRLGWLDLPDKSRALVPRLADLRAAFSDVDRVVLSGTGGAALAAEAIARSEGLPLTVLDSTDPGLVRRVAGEELDRTAMVVSGTGLEADGHRRIFERAFRYARIDPADRVVVVADPGSPLENLAKTSHYRVVPSDPDLGGRYGALSASALTPTALAGADPDELLEQAAALRLALRQPYDNPGLTLGAALGAAAGSGRNKLAIAEHESGLPGLAGWVEHLLAESTGKDGAGILPVVTEGTDAPGFEAAPDVRRLIIGSLPAEGGPTEARDVGLLVAGPLGGQFLLWQYATVVAARVIGVNPFNQPDLRESEDNAAALLRGAEEGTVPTVIAGEPALVCGAVEVHAPGSLLRGVKDLAETFDALLRLVPDQGYLSLMAFLDRAADGTAASLRPALAARAAVARKHPVPVTFGWGPRALHATGQYHKGGPRNGVHCQITGVVADDMEIPGRPYTLGHLQLAQAFGDLRTLRAQERPVVRLHLRDRAEGLAQLLGAIEGGLASTGKRPGAEGSPRAGRFALGSG